MTDTPNRPALWQAMDDGMDAQANKEVGQTDPLAWSRRIRAAEIRALRDWLVPEEAEAPVGDGEPWPQSYQHRSDAMWEQRQILRALLTAEADRAERGDA